jgi:hypothetical protein
MFGVLFSVLVIIVPMSICGEIIMRVRLTKRASCDKIAWWRRGGDEVATTYGELFPESRLPLFRRFVFWLILGAASVIILLAILWKSK